MAKYEATTTPAVIKNSSTAKLIELFILTDSWEDENIPTVRGWIMDELEARDPEAFDAWLEDEVGDGEALRKYYAA